MMDTGYSCTIWGDLGENEGGSKQKRSKRHIMMDIGYSCSKSFRIAWEASKNSPKDTYKQNFVFH